jgi:hypothetical protein
VVGDFPSGGALWTWYLQYLLGLVALGHDVYALELLWARESAAEQQAFIRLYWERMRRAGLLDRAILLRQPDSAAPLTPDGVVAHGPLSDHWLELARSSDLFFNLCGSIEGSLLSLFSHRVLIDTDPGVYQLAAREWDDVGLDDHQALFTMGPNVGGADCPVPTDGRQWQTFRPFVHLPAWPQAPPPRRRAPFTALTSWEWETETFSWGGEELNTSKREAFLAYVELPQLTGRRFTIAANIHPLDDTGDRELLAEHGWRWIHPETVARTPLLFRRFIERSHAEISCAKPIYRKLNTGWLGDRDICYLAAGRPVLCEDTGFSRWVPCASGLVAFSDIEQAQAGVLSIDADYPRHARDARALVEEHFDAGPILQSIIERS